MKKISVCVLLVLLLCFLGCSATITDEGLSPTFATSALGKSYEDSFERLRISESEMEWDETGFAASYNGVVDIFGLDMKLVLYMDESYGKPCEYMLTYMYEGQQDEAAPIIKQLYDGMKDEYGNPDDYGFARTIADNLEDIQNISGQTLADGWKSGKYDVRLTYEYESQAAAITIRISEK